jgi:hypothetical protein
MFAHEKKIPEWQWGRSAEAGLLEIDPPPLSLSLSLIGLDSGHVATVSRCQARAQ